MFITGLGRWCAREAAPRTRRGRKNRRNWWPALEQLESRQVLTGAPIDIFPGMDYEGDSGSKYLNFIVSLTGPISQPLDVFYETADVNSFDGAEAGSDYVATSGTLRFEPDGPTSQVVAVEVIGDTQWEFNEHFQVTYTPSDGSGAVPSDGFIANDDAFPQVSISDAIVVEGPAGAGDYSYAEFTITRTGAAGNPLNLAYETIFDTADSEDLPYTGVEFTLEPGEMSRTILIRVYPDGDIEPDETFFVNLYAFDRFVEVVDGQGVGTIINDDPTVLYGIGDHLYYETDSDVSSFLGFAALSPSDVPFQVRLRTVNGTATAGSDFSAVDQLVTIQPGESIVELPITIFGDNEVEPDETFTIEVRGLLGNLLASATATIFNDDYVNHPPVVSMGGPYQFSEAHFAQISQLNLPSQIDPDQPNSTLSYEWDLDYDGVTFHPGPAFEGPVSSLGWDGPSTHTIALRVTDENGAVSNIATTTVEIYNLAPSAYAGEDRTVVEGTTVALLGQYLDVDPVTVLWHLASTTSGQSIPDQTTPELAFTVDAGSYTFEFTATDDEGASVTDTLIVTALNISPRVTVQPQTVVEGATVHMSSTVQAPSTDTLIFNWQQNNTNNQLFPMPNAASFDFVPIDNGNYFFVLRVFDDELTSGTGFALVTVLNAPPVVDAGADQTAVEGSSVTLSGSATDPGLDALSYHWQLVSSTNGQSVPDQNTAGFAFTPTDQGTYVFELTVTDDDGASSTDTLVVTVNNAAPSTDAGSDQTVVEGSTVTISGSATDPGSDQLSYLWQLVSSSNGQPIADQTTSSFQFMPTDNGVYTFQLTVTDDDGASSTDTVVVTVNNAPPTANINGASAGVGGQTLSFQIASDDSSGADLAAGFSYQLDWGDGSAVESLSGGSSLSGVHHVFANSGTYMIHLTAIDKDGGHSTPVTWSVDIAQTLLSGSILYVGGSDGNDTIAINSAGAGGSVGVTINGVSQGTFSALSRVVVFGGDGNDTLSLQQNLVLDAWLFGGAGNDVLASARGNDILSGGAGADVLSSDRGRDLLFGGAGLDVLAAGQDDDILVSGLSSYETDEVALGAIMAEWTSSHGFVTRQRNLQDGSGSADRLNDHYFLQLGVTVFDDGESDSVSTGSGSDWTF